MIVIRDVITKTRLVLVPTKINVGGYDANLSPENGLYSQLENDPEKLCGRIFQLMTKCGESFKAEQTLLKIIYFSASWKEHKPNQSPNLGYCGIGFQELDTPLKAIEESEKYNEEHK